MRFLYKFLQLLLFLAHDLFQLLALVSFTNVTYLQNIILKSEWRRLKQEVEKGHELEIKEVEEIYKEIAIKHNESMYLGA